MQQFYLSSDSFLSRFSHWGNVNYSMHSKCFHNQYIEIINIEPFTNMQNVLFMLCDLLSSTYLTLYSLYKQPRFAYAWIAEVRYRVYCDLAKYCVCAWHLSGYRCISWIGPPMAPSHIRNNGHHSNLRLKNGLKGTITGAIYMFDSEYTYIIFVHIFPGSGHHWQRPGSDLEPDSQVARHRLCRAHGSEYR